MKITPKNLKLNKLFKEEDSRFLLSCGVKFSALFLMGGFFIYYVMWVMISINSIYFESMGFLSSPALKDAFFDNSLAFVYEKLPHLFTFLIILFFIGVYTGKILMRPFEIIGSYCLDKTEGKNVSYNPDIFSDYKLLTRFSEFFFRYMDDCLKQKSIEPNTVPPSFTKIHQPPFERVFFFHFMLFVGIVAIITSSFSIYVAAEIQAQLIDLSIKTLHVDGGKVGYFLEHQTSIFQSLTFISTSIIILSYVFLSFHLYSKVSGAVFAFFSTMRAYMKGNRKARVHLIGYSQIRPHGRSFNKYLDFVERECAKPKNEVESTEEKIDKEVDKNN